MSTTLETKLHIDSWDEKPYRELEDGSKFTRAEVTLSADEEPAADGITRAFFDAVMFYRPDGHSRFVVLMQATGTLGGRSGTFVLSGDGASDAEQAQFALSVIEGAATGELDGLTGSFQSTSSHADYPYMPLSLRYDLP